MELIILWVSLTCCKLFGPAVSREQSPVLTRNSNENWTSLGQLKRKPEFPVVTRQSRRNSRKNTWFQRLRKMRPLPTTASQGKSIVPPWSAKRYLKPFVRTPKFPRHPGSPRREHRESRHRFIRAPSPLLIKTGESIPLRGPEGVPGPPGAPQDEAGLTRKFETSHVGGATGRTPPIPRSAFEKDPRPGPLFEGNPVGEGTTRRGTDTPVHRPQRPAGSTHSSTRGLSPPGCSSWNSTTLAIWCEELTPWKWPWCWEGLKAGGEGGGREWDDQITSLTEWAWIWANWLEKSMDYTVHGSQRVRHDWVTFTFTFDFIIIYLPEWLNLRQWQYQLSWIEYRAISLIVAGNTKWYSHIEERLATS